MEDKIKIYITTPGTRYAGLMSYFIQAISNLYIVKDTKNKLFIKYDEHMRYKDMRCGNNVWDYYFEQPFNFLKEEINAATKIKDIWHEGCLPIPPRPTIDTLKECNEIYKKYIVLKPHIKEKIQTFLNEKTNNTDKILAVHKRGTDHITDAPLLSIEAYFDHVDQYIDSYDRLLLCTDEEYTVTKFKKRYTDKLITYDSMRSRVENNIGVHQSIGLYNPYKMGEDVIVETFLMAQSNFLIKTVSNVSNSSLIINSNLQYLEIDRHINYNI